MTVEDKSRISKVLVSSIPLAIILAPSTFLNLFAEANICFSELELLIKDLTCRAPPTPKLHLLRLML